MLSVDPEDRGLAKLDAWGLPVSLPSGYRLLLKSILRGVIR